LDTGLRVVGPFFGSTRVDNVSNTWDGEGCFGDVGGDDDESVILGRRFKD
jgi:hypothetical protein